jgi:hypothetical protein
MRAYLASTTFLAEALLSTVWTLRPLSRGNKLAIHNRHQFAIVCVTFALQVCLKRWKGMHEALTDGNHALRHIVTNDARP